jgi:putative DNA primase/helicase
MQGVLPDGCAIRTAIPQPIMGVAEGIETALSASIMYEMPVWACINGNLLSKWIPPKICKEVHIFADNDSNYAGQSKAYILAHRLKTIFKLNVVLYIPPTSGVDYNDIHREKLKAEGALFKVIK